MTDTHSAVVAAEGHLVDSQQLKAIFDKVIERGGAFEVQHFQLGRTNDEYSRLTLKVEAPSAPALEDLLEELLPFGCHAVDVQDATVRVTEKDGCVPDDFYSTTNQRTDVRVGGVWLEVEPSAHGCRSSCWCRAARCAGNSAKSAQAIASCADSKASASGPSSGTATQGRFRVHDERDLLREARRSERRPHRRDDAATSVSVG